jgi:microcystin-dependent protein
MPVPIPITFLTTGAPPDVPRSVQELMNVIGDSLGTAFARKHYILGQLNGVLPTQDVGPWANGSQWWFWDATQGQYLLGAEGVPVGMMMYWGGTGVPKNWLLCDGSPIDRVQYSQLFAVIHEDWGPGDGVTTFNLPPPAVMYCNVGGTLAWGDRGGQQTIPIVIDNLPALAVTIKTTLRNKTTAGGLYGVPVLQPANQPGAQQYQYQVENANGLALNTLQTLTPGPPPTGAPPAGQATGSQPMASMPPFAAANIIIKFM